MRRREGPRGGRGARALGRGGTRPGRTHETLVEADQPRLPVVVENQNRLNHLCRPRSFQRRRPPRSVYFRHNTATSAWCAAERGRRKRAPAPEGSCREESGVTAPPGESARVGSRGIGPVRTPRPGRVVTSASAGRPIRARPGREPGSLPFGRTDRLLHNLGPSASGKQIPKPKLLRATAPAGDEAAGTSPSPRPHGSMQSCTPSPRPQAHTRNGSQPA